MDHSFEIFFFRICPYIFFSSASPSLLRGTYIYASYDSSLAIMNIIVFRLIFLHIAFLLFS